MTCADRFRSSTTESVSWKCNRTTVSHREKACWITPIPSPGKYAKQALPLALQSRVSNKHYGFQPFRADVKLSGNFCIALAWGRKRLDLLELLLWKILEAVGEDQRIYVRFISLTPVISQETDRVGFLFTLKSSPRLCQDESGCRYIHHRWISVDSHKTTTYACLIRFLQQWSHPDPPIEPIPSIVERRKGISPVCFYESSHIEPYLSKMDVPDHYSKELRWRRFKRSLIWGWPPPKRHTCQLWSSDTQIYKNLFNF